MIAFRVREICAAAALLLLAACGAEPKQEAAPVRPVRVVTVEERKGGDAVSLTGTVQAQTEVSLAFRIPGRVTDRYVNVGDRVEAGQVIARLDRTDDENGWRAARAQLVAAQARLLETRNDYVRQRELLASGFAPRARYDQALQARSAAESAVDAAEAQLAVATNRLGYADLVSDAPGVVIARGVEVGEVVQAGRMIVQLARQDGRDAVFDVPPAIKDAAPADPLVEVALTMDGTVRAQGRVREVSPQADAVTGTFQVRVGLSDIPPAMRLGSTVTGRLELNATAGIRIPASALTRQGQDAAVWVVDQASSKVALRPIQVDRFDPAYVSVGGGLVPGDVVVVAGVQALRPGQQVRLAGAPQ